jgi:probable rRNA maturation factor
LTVLIKSRAPGAAALANVELSIALVDDKTIHRINKRWRKKDKATDVLSFPQLSVSELKALPLNTQWLLGDIIISVPTAIGQAKALKHSLKFELQRLLAHGILHLLGYDHEIGPKEEKRMQRLERKLLTL